MNKENKIPLIRFKGYTEDWEQRKLGEMSLLITKGTTPINKSGEGTINFIKIENINADNGEIIPEMKISEDEHNGYLKRSQLQENDILFSIAGTLGRVSTVKSSILPANTNQALAIIRIKDGVLNYITTVLKGNAVTDFIKKNPTVGAQPNLSLEQVGNLEIPYPILSEQTKIGTYFQSLDNLITLHQRKCESLKKVKKSMLQKMFPKNGESVPEIRFAGFTDPWEQRKLGEVVNVCSGRDYKHLDEGNIPVYGTGGYMLSVSEALSENEDAIGIGRKGTIDSPYVLKAPFWTVDTLFYCIPNKNNDLNFVYGLYQKINWKSMDESTGVPSLSKTAINNVDVSTTSLSEQQKIGSYFQSLDNLITLHQRKVEKLKNIKKSMLQKMFV